MSNLIFRNNEDTLTLPIPESALGKARQLADLFEDVATARQVYLDTLAVLTVNDYLQMMGFATDPQSSDSLNPLLRLGADISDLYVVGFGHLECRAVLPKARSCFFPQEVWEDRIGYMIVEVDEAQRQANLLGFVQEITTPELSLDYLQPLEALLYHLHQFQQQVASDPVSIAPSPSRLSSSFSPTFLSRWFEQVFEAGWQSLDSLLETDLNLSFNLRTVSPHSVMEIAKGAKLIDLSIDLNQQKVFLLIYLIPETAKETGVLIQVHPTRRSAYLPPNLRLTLLSETGEPLREVCSRSLDNYIQLPYFQGSQGENFLVQIGFNQFSLTENFVL